MKLIAFDLDGTTITEDMKLSDKNREALKEAQDNGVILVPATGRMRTFIPDDVLNFEGIRYFITSNGAGIYDAEKSSYIDEILIPNEKAQQIQQVLEKYDLFVEYYIKGRATTKIGNPERARDHFGFPEHRLPYIKKNYEFTEDYMGFLKSSDICPEKINMSYIRPEIYDKVWQEVENLGDVYVTTSLPYNLEICSIYANKGEALRRLTEHLDISMSEVMAIGDNENDVSMLKLAGYSVAVANAHDVAKEAAKYSTARYDEDGLAHAIEKYLPR